MVYWIGLTSPLGDYAETPCWLLRKVCVLLVLALFLIFIPPLTPSALAHSFYDAECCSDYDCAPVPMTEIPREGDGGFYLIDGRHVPYRGLKPSPDGRWHLCEQQWPAERKDRKVLCVYAPIGGS